MIASAEGPRSRPRPRSRRMLYLFGWLALGLAIAGAGVVVLLWLSRPRLSEETLREALYATIQREAEQAFLVTGSLDLTATTRVSNTRRFLPGLLDLNLGTASATVRIPGRVSYGFDVNDFRREMIRVHGDTLIEVELPPLAIYSIEPDLAEMEVETSVGWARLRSASGREVERRALEIVEPALRTQGEAHIRSSAQPRINSARALERLLAPVVRSAGIEEPRFRFRVAAGITVDSDR